MHGFLAFILAVCFQSLKSQHILYSTCLNVARLCTWAFLACVIILPSPICPKVGHFCHPLKFTSKKLIILGNSRGVSYFFKLLRRKGNRGGSSQMSDF